MWSGTRKMRLTNGMAGFQSLPFLTNQKIISVIFWLVHIIQWDSCVNSQSNLIGPESCDLIDPTNQVTGFPGNQLLPLFPNPPHSTDLSFNG